MTKIIALLACLCLLLPMSVYFVAADGTLTIAQAIEMGSAMEHNVYTEEKYSVTGEIVEVYNTQYGNMKLSDGNGNVLTIYGTYNADGTLRYDAMEVKPAVGDTVTIYGIVGQYNNTPQIKNGWVTNLVPGSAESTDPEADSELTIAQAIELGTSKLHNVYTAAKYYVIGQITEVYNEQYGNMRITDTNGNILTIYGTYGADGADRYDALAEKPVAGNYVKLYGIIGQYNNTPQMKNGWIVEFSSEPIEPSTPSEPSNPSNPDLPAPSDENTLSIKEALDLGATTGDNVYTEEKYYVTGKIVVAPTVPHGNMYIEDENGDQLYVYGTWSADGSTKYGDMAEKPDAGDTVTLYGAVGSYAGKPQMKNAWIISYEAGELEEENTDPKADSVLTIKEAIALGSSKLHDTYTEGKYYVTGEITEVYNEQYGNMRITDAEGNILTIYGSYSEDGETRYDELETKPVAGDTVILYGIIGQYNGTAQMKNAWIVPSLPEIDDDDNNNDDGNIDNGNTDNGNTDNGNIDDGNTDNGNNDTQGETDKMGENAAIIALAAVLMALAAAGVIVFNKKRA